MAEAAIWFGQQVPHQYKYNRSSILRSGSSRSVRAHTAAQIEAGMRFVIIVPESCAQSVWDSFLSVWNFEAPAAWALQQSGTS